MTNAEIDARLAKMDQVQSLAELAGWEAQARMRGFYPGEIAAILQRRRELERGR